MDWVRQRTNDRKKGVNVYKLDEKESTTMTTASTSLEKMVEEKRSAVFCRGFSA